MSMNRRMFLKTLALLALPAHWPRLGFLRTAQAATPVRVGVLFSLTGGLSIIEKSLHDATLMAISEINANGGVIGKKIEADRRGRRLRSQDLQREGFQARHRGPRPDGVRLLHLGEPQGGLAGVREAQQSVLLSYLLRRLRVLEERRLHRRRSQPAALQLHPWIIKTSARRSSSSSARTTSIRAKWPRSARS